MTDHKSTSDVAGTSLSHQQTETSPLKQSESKKNWLSHVLWTSSNYNDQGSLKAIVLCFFIFTVLVTLGLLAQLYYGGYTPERHGSVVTDSEECTEIGLQILKKGGNAVDAAIASTMCLGVVHFHVTGLGGGGYMMIYNHMKQKVIDIIDFQVTVPNSQVNNSIDTVDGLSVGVPGLLKGMWEAHLKYGKLPWQELIKPAANLAKYGFLVSENLVSAGGYLKRDSKYNQNLVEVFKSLRVGKNVSFPQLAATLEFIAVIGPHELYNGSIAKDIVYTVKEANGNMTMNDVIQYQIYHTEILHTRFGKFDIIAPGSSAGGAFLLNALDSIQFLDLTPDDDISSIVLKLSDILHDTYMTFLTKNNINFMPSEPVASQVSTVDNDEIYVSTVTGLNTWLGSQLLTRTGFILNNAVSNGGMNVHRRPVSFSTPVIALESGEICGKRFVLGSGDASIAAQVLTNALMLNCDLNASVEFPRFFVSNIPRLIRVEDLHEPFYSSDVIKKLGTLLRLEKINLPYKSVNVIEKIGDAIFAYPDSRSGGTALKF